MIQQVTESVPIMDGGAGGLYPPGFAKFLQNLSFCLKFWHFYAYSPLTFQLAPALSNSLRRLCLCNHLANSHLAGKSNKIFGSLYISHRVMGNVIASQIFKNSSLV